MTFYDVISQLCIEKGVSMRKMSADNGLSGAITAKWRSDGKPSAKTVKILADYFGKTPQGLLSMMDGEIPATTKDTPILAFDLNLCEDSIGDTELDQIVSSLHEDSTANTGFDQITMPKKAKMKTSVDFEAITAEIAELCKMGTKDEMPVTGTGIGRLLILHFVCKHNGVIVTSINDIDRLSMALPNSDERHMYGFFARLYCGLEDCREKTIYDWYEVASFRIRFVYELSNQIKKTSELRSEHILSSIAMERNDMIKSFRNILRYNDLISACADELGISALIGARIDTADLLADIEEYNKEIDRLKTFWIDIEDTLKKVDIRELMRHPPQQAIKNMRGRIHSYVYTLASNLRLFINECNIGNGVTI
jgi:transcriptional regulator with XRE-family HTH domain